jgi:hypothetical protein
MTYDPYVELRSRPALTVVWNVDMPQHGRWYQHLQTMLIRRGLTQAARRCTVTHELIHAERCDLHCDALVHELVARRLITLDALATAALFHGDDLTGVADELWVDVETLKIRLDHLHPSERGFLQRRISMRESTA